MDPRIREHAEIIVDHSTKVEKGDNVMVSAPPIAEDLVVAIYEKLGEIGAKPSFSGRSDRANRAYMRSIDKDDLESPEHSLAAMKETDVVIIIHADENTNETGDIDPEKTSEYTKVRREITEERMRKRWVGTQFPAPGNAQDAEMSTEAYEDFVWNAVNKDWEAQRRHQERMVELLDPADEVHIVSGDTTDISMSVEGMIAANDYGEYNLPGGEVYTAPVPDSVKGE
ncbi:MAG: aminopeptidase, partial [Halobacteria archaeon]|nr:aminopeptidase [Halobacteria archaeon]